MSILNTLNNQFSNLALANQIVSTTTKFSNNLSILNNNQSSILASCLDENTLILCLNNDMTDVLIFIKDLKPNMIVKTYKHGYRRIKYIIKGTLLNDINNKKDSLYIYHKIENSIKDLILTGGHSILVDTMTDEENILNNEYFQNNVPIIDNKYCLLACVSKSCTQIEDTNEYTYYNLVLDNDNITDRYGIWADGVLVETPSEEYYKSICD